MDSLKDQQKKVMVAQKAFLDAAMDYQIHNGSESVSFNATLEFHDVFGDFVGKPS